MDLTELQRLLGRPGTYFSPVDFTATYLSATTLTLADIAGKAPIASFLTTNSQIRGVLEIQATSGDQTYWSSRDDKPAAYAAGTLTLPGAGFVTGSAYIVVISGQVKGLPANEDRAIIAKVDAYSDAPATIEGFEITRPMNVVVSPGSDMPYLAVRRYDDLASAVGFPAQAANPAAYVSLIGDANPPIILSHKPKLLRPGYYVVAMPQLSYLGDAWDHEHAWPAAALQAPVVLLEESDEPVEMSHYAFTTLALAGDNSPWTPWLKAPQSTGAFATSSGSYPHTKILGFGWSNATGANMVATCRLYFYSKNLTRPDIVANIEENDNLWIANINDGARLNGGVERFGWFKVRIYMDQTGVLPAGVGIIVA